MAWAILWISVILCLRNVVWGQIVYSVSEESTTGTVAGYLAKDLNLDINELQSRGFEIVDGPTKGYFHLDVKTGVLHVNDRIDRERLCGRSVKCSLELEAILNSPLNMYRFEVNVLDINDNAPVFRTSSLSINISESAFPGQKFSLPRAFDLDVGSNSVKTYRLNQNEHFSLDVQNVGESVSAELVLQKALDREKQHTVKLILTALDGGKPARSGSMNLDVNVIDVNDNIPVFSKELYKAKVTENAATGTSVIGVHATDLDEGSNGEIMYSFINHDGENNIDLFAIDQLTGEITVIGEVDFERDKAIEIRVKAEDKGSSPRVSHCKVLVEIVDINDNSPIISVTSLANQIQEDTVKGTMVGLITVTDGDTDHNGAITISLLESVPFKIQNTYKNKYALIVDGPLDREALSRYNISIRATDKGNPPLSSIHHVSLLISDVNDNAPRFVESDMCVYVKENSDVGAVMFTVTALDPDMNANAKITYSFVSKRVPISSFVNINSETGEIYALQSFDYEKIKSFSFQVQAADSGSPPLSSNTTITVYVLDENDNSPLVLPPYSGHGSVNTENIPYSAEAGYFVAKIRAVDADSGYNALLSYHISEPKGNNLFRIGTSSGEIRTKRRMSDSDLKTHPLLVVVSDHGEPSMSATVSIDVVVMEHEDEFKTQFRHVPIKDEAFSDLNMYLLIAIASVSVIFLLSLISLIAVRCHRTDNDFSGYNPPMITTHPDGTWSYSKSTQQYDVCFSSDTLKSDMVVFPTPFPPVDGELISINEGDTYTRTQTLPNKEKVSTKLISSKGLTIP